MTTSVTSQFLCVSCLGMPLLVLQDPGTLTAIKVADGATVLPEAQGPLPSFRGCWQNSFASGLESMVVTSRPSGKSLCCLELLSF